LFSSIKPRAEPMFDFKLMTGKERSPEERFLLLCCRADFNEQTRLQVEAQVKAGLDWHVLWRLAVQENVLPLVCHRLLAFDGTQMPISLLAEMKRQLFDNASRNILFINELSRVLELLQQRGIRALTFKGPVLAITAYGGANLRRYNDVDIIVPEQDYARCRSHLFAHGYELLKDFGFEVAIRHKESWAIVDLHRTVTSSAFPFPTDFDSWWNRREGVDVSGHSVPALSVMDHLLIVIVQIARDRYEDKLILAKLCDVAALLHTHPAVDVDRVVSEAERLGVRRRVLAVLGAVAELLALPLPAKATACFESEVLLARLARFTEEGVLDRPEGNVRSLYERILFHFNVHERVGHKLAQLWMVPFKLKELLEERS